MTTVTLDLPEQTIQQARQAALALQRPVEEILTELLTAVLPAIDNVPIEMQAEVTSMVWLDNKQLWALARSSMPTEDNEQLQYLGQLQQQRSLTATEKTKLEELRRVYGRTTLRKARAYALLSLRGGKPLLEHL